MDRVFHKPLTGRGKPKRTEYRGIVYDSKAEAERAAILDVLQRAGKIEWWIRQVPIDIGEPGVDKPYRVDFLVAERANENAHGGVSLYIHAEEVKGFMTPTFRRHMKQWQVRGPFPLHIINGKTLQIIKQIIQDTP